MLMGRVPVFAQPVDQKARHMFLFGDWGALDPEPQRKVSGAMTAYAKQHGISPEALFLLGDNFYGQFDGGVNCPRWQTQFEEMYPASEFKGPCYALLGNHDYIVEPAGKRDCQLA